MTVTYSLEVSSSSFFCLYRLLFRWKGSVWKSVWSELCVWLFFYGVLSTTYRLVLTGPQRELFEDISIFCDTYSSFIPITFMLGFYVSAVFTRWGQIFENIGWIDTPGLMIAVHVEGTSELARNIRRNAMRYMVLTQALVFRDVSVSVRKRFPTLNHLVTAGLMTEKELEMFNSVASQYVKYWPPMQWLFTELKRAREMGLIASDIIYTDLIEKIRVFRVNVLTLTMYDWVSVPLLYTQVVHLAVRSFFMVGLMGRQFLQPTRQLSHVGFKHTIDIYVPIMSILQIIFFVGWMKVAEVMLNPLGEDDDDFETNWILDRNLQVGMSMVDDQYDKTPPMERDAFWEDVMAEPLYTQAAIRPCNPQVGSCANIPAQVDDFVMLRCRRTSLQNHLDMEDAEVVPVTGVDWRPGSRYGSSESHAFSHSFLGQSNRKLSEIIQRIRPRFSSSTFDRKAPASARTAEEAPPSPGKDSLNTSFAESFTSMPNMSSYYMNGSIQPEEKNEEKEPTPLPVIHEEGKRSPTDSDPTLSPPTPSPKKRRFSYDSVG